MSNKSKRRKAKSLSDLKQNGGDKNKYHSNGHAHVRGEVQVSFPPLLIEKHDAEQHENSSREDTKQLILHAA
jgi:hypothetical protein